MSEMSDRLNRIDQAIEELRDARHHVKHGKPAKAEIDIVDALRYISIAFGSLDHRHNHCHDCCHNKCHHNCCCDHSHHKNISLASQKFFSKVSSGTTSGANLIIPANTFVDNNGNGITALPSVFHFYNLYINGMIQENGVVSISPFLILIVGGAILDSDDPIILEFVVSI